MDLFQRKYLDVRDCGDCKKLTLSKCDRCNELIARDCAGLVKASCEKCLSLQSKCCSKLCKLQKNLVSDDDLLIRVGEKLMAVPAAAAVISERYESYKNDSNHMRNMGNMTIVLKQLRMAGLRDALLDDITEGFVGDDNKSEVPAAVVKPVSVITAKPAVPKEKPTPVNVLSVAPVAPVVDETPAVEVNESPSVVVEPPKPNARGRRGRGKNQLPFAPVKDQPKELSAAQRALAALNAAASVSEHNNIADD